MAREAGYPWSVASLDSLFPTKLYRARIARADALNVDLAHASRVIADADKAGQAWCRQHGYRGYTSYASLNDLPWRDPTFAALKDELDAHATAFARELDYDLAGRTLAIDSMWVNILAPGGAHSGHIHPLSVLSGVYYVDVPDGASALKLEDPRLAMMMAGQRGARGPHQREFQLCAGVTRARRRRRAGARDRSVCPAAGAGVSAPETGARHG